MQFEKAVAKASALPEDPREMNATLHRSGCWRTEATVCDVPDQAEPGGVDQDATSSGSLRMDAAFSSSWDLSSNPREVRQ